MNMEKFKHFITPVTAAFMLLCMPLLAHAADNSVLVYPGEGNSTCNNSAPNKTIESMSGSTSAGSGQIFGNENVNDPDNPGGESAYYEVDLSTNSFRFYDSTTPIDFVVLKATEGVLLYFLPSGGLYDNSDMVVTDDLGNNVEIAAFSLCYGLGNEPEPEPPVNQPPVLDPIGDKEVTVGSDLMFTVSATDDGLPSNTLIIEHSTLPTGASFTDYGDGTGNFEWLNASPAGSTNVTFTVSDGALIDTETITITVNEIPPEPLATPACGLNIDKLDDTGIACPDPEYEYDGEGNIIGVKNPSVVCQWELKKEFYGFADGSDVCCICNGDALVKCDPELPAGSPPNAAGEYSCNLTKAAKAELDLPAGEATTIIEFNNDPYYCYTSGGSRICYCYGSLCPTR